MKPLKSISAPKYYGMSIQTHRGPLIEMQLAKIFEILTYCQEEYLETFCVRVDLHFPENYALINNTVVEKFIASLRAKLTHSEAIREKTGIRIHHTKLRFIWCREISTTGRPHYHFLLMTNKQAYGHLGFFNLDYDNLYSRICHAWSSALGISPNTTVGLVHFPDNHTMVLRRDCRESLSKVFHRVSYFAKQETKQLGQSFHTLGTSRG